MGSNIEQRGDEVYLDRQQSHRVDQIAIEEFGIPGIVLMENAGRGCCEILFQIDSPNAVIILGGVGNNGGDGFVIARHLANRGVAVKVFLVGAVDRMSNDARIQLEIIRRMGTPILSVSTDWPIDRLTREMSEIEGRPVDWIVDGLLGTGARGNPRAPMDQVIWVANSSLARRMAIDLPSGLDCDTGLPGKPTFQAGITCTMVARKKGFLATGAQSWLGQVFVIDIGAPRAILERMVGKGAGD